MTVPTLETTGTPLSQAQQARAIQAALAVGLARDVNAAWPALDRKRLDATWPQWIQLMVTLVNRYRAMSALAATIYYQDVRETVVGQRLSESLLKLAPDADPQQLERAFGFSGPGVLSSDKYQDSSALSITQGTAQRFAADAGRGATLDAVKADRKALGYYRETDARPCPFCALLASRGPVYKHDSFAESNARFSGPGEIKVHNDCGCFPTPLFDRSQPLPAVSTTADRIYRDQISHLPNYQRLGAFRKAWEAHLASQDA